MKNQDEQIDKLFTTSLENYEEIPSSSAWESIESQLPKNKSRTMYWVAASVVAVLLTSTVVWNSILKQTNEVIYETNNVSLKANYPQKEFAPLPILIYTNTIVYVDREVYITAPSSIILEETEVKNIASTTSSFELKSMSNNYSLNTNISETPSVKLIYNPNEPITIIYKKGDPKHPKLAKAANFFKQVGDGERPLIDFGKISTSVIARRETNNNSNN